MFGVKTVVAFLFGTLVLALPNHAQSAEAFHRGDLTKFEAVLTCAAAIIVESKDSAIESCKIDPTNVQAFQLDIAFDPSKLQFIDVRYLSPYVAVGTPDLSRLAEGLLQDVAGVAQTPSSGDVDLYEARFRLLDRSAFPQFTVFASSNDFVDVLDTVTGQIARVAPQDILPCETKIPEPSTHGLLITGLAIVAGYDLRRRRQYSCLSVQNHLECDDSVYDSIAAAPIREACRCGLSRTAQI
jgi:hypothetical protein